MAENEITKRRVTMRSITADPANPKKVLTLEAIDYVRPDFLDAYVADARRNWQVVEVSDEPDAGPAGYDGSTTVPAHLDHELAGTFYPATDMTKAKASQAAPEGYTIVTEG